LTGPVGDGTGWVMISKARKPVAANISGLGPPRSARSGVGRSLIAVPMRARAQQFSEPSRESMPRRSAIARRVFARVEGLRSPVAAAAQKHSGVDVVSITVAHAPDRTPCTARIDDVAENAKALQYEYASVTRTISEHAVAPVRGLPGPASTASGRAASRCGSGAHGGACLQLHPPGGFAGSGLVGEQIS